MKIGTWIRRQRMIRDGRADGVITPERISRLNDIGMVWADSFTSRWEYGYEQVQKWYAEHGNLNVPTMYVNDRGFPLGRWFKRHVPNENGKTQIKITHEKSNVGIIRKLFDEKRTNGYNHANSYLSSMKGQDWTQTYVSLGG